MEINQIMPDSLLFGSAILYLLTQNAPYGIFAIFIYLLSLTHHGIGWLYKQIFSDASVRTNIQCYFGFKTPQYRVERILSHNPFPSYGLFVISAVATYLGCATHSFTDTFDEMQKDNPANGWGARPIVAYCFIGIYLLLTLLFTIYLECGSLGMIMMVFVLGIVSGLLFFLLSKSVFGLDGLNFLGLPFLVDKSSQGDPLYICVKEEKTM
jgi:hypothetical protein